MPTYADEYNERLLALGQSGPSNPVRLTISKGDYVWDPQTARFRYEEQWEEEHLMEHGELYDEPQLAPSPSNGNADSHDSSPPLITALQPTTLHGRAEGVTHQPSLWVLDTNTLMSCLDLLKALFAALLTRNVAYAASVRQSSADPTRPALIKLVIPYVVVSELDGLKITRRQDDSGRPVASQAREANHWLLSALQKQKRVPIDEAGSTLSEDLWPLFVQPSTHYHRSKRSNGAGSRWEGPLSCDDEIVKFCADLKKQTPSSVCFCSGDINARTKAELDGIDSLGMREMANAQKLNFQQVQSTEQKWTYVADAIIEQWEYQDGMAQQQPIEDSNQQQYHSTQLQHQNGQHLDPTAWHSNGSSYIHQMPSQLDPYIHSTHASNQHTSVHHTAVNDILEVDMDTEDQHPPPQTGPTPIPLMSVHPAGQVMRTSPSAEGRGTNDSIHSPHNKQQTSRSRLTRAPVSPSRHQTAAPAAATTDTQVSEAEALNPQISWEDLVKQLGPSSRTSNRHRNGTNPYSF